MSESHADAVDRMARAAAGRVQPDAGGAEIASAVATVLGEHGHRGGAFADDVHVRVTSLLLSWSQARVSEPLPAVKVREAVTAAAELALARLDRPGCEQDAGEAVTDTLGFLASVGSPMGRVTGVATLVRQELDQMLAARMSERADLRPMAMRADDVRPGMVRVDWESGPGRRHTVADTREVGCLPELVQILGETVHLSELAWGDVYRDMYGWRTHRAGVDPAAGRGRTSVVRAYIDPQWELDQSRADS